MKNLLLILLTLAFSVSFSQDSPEVVLESQVEVDLHPKTQIRDLEIEYPQMVEELRNDKDYAYMRDLDSLLRSRNKTSPENEIPMGTSIFDSPWFFYSAIVIVSIFVLYLLFRIYRSKGTLFRRNKQKISALKVEETFHETNHGDLEAEIRIANYRMATRILFLRTLDALHDAGKIEYLPGKSNREYITEMEMPLRSDFKFLVLKYEYYWYGNHQPSWEQFDIIEKDFIGFLNRYTIK